ncbi:hypothetical protein GJ697_13535 [Pseudoduganella sp. FT25W]|uniref:Uncharacterized protein n=1 Tax=Duganella alba TaxID=2666081 RepID=A0A6L5QGK3_9BURK|nr:hypothetical protein [Duganella alba]MRX08859.1 hypothetical protein [Duganella alba]MRX18847.1 hypothetical protein [Duganella alba]
MLAGCGSTAAPVTQRVEVPVSVSCIKSADVPRKLVYQFDKLLATAGDGEKVIALASDWPRIRKYEGQLETVIEGCR